MVTKHKSDIWTNFDKINACYVMLNLLFCLGVFILDTVLMLYSIVSTCILKLFKMPIPNQ